LGIATHTPINNQQLKGKKKTLEFFPEWMEILTCGLHFPCARSDCSTAAMFLYYVMYHYGNMKDIVSSL